MARGIHRLTQLQLKRARKRGLYGDGGGLYLQVGPSGSRSWVFRYKRDGRARMMGLGSLAVVDQLQRAGGNAGLLPQLDHEGRKLRKSQGGMMLHGAELALSREQVLEVALPSGGGPPNCVHPRAAQSALRPPLSGVSEAMMQSPGAEMRSRERSGLFEK